MIVFGITAQLTELVHTDKDVVPCIERLFDTDQDKIGKPYWQKERFVEPAETIRTLSTGTFVAVSC